MTEIIDTAAFEAALRELEMLSGPVVIELTPAEAWIVLSQLQLALRHPQNTGPSAKIAREIAQRIQAVVARESVLAAVAEAGWQEVGGHG